MKRKSYVEEMAQTLRSIGRHSLKPDWDAENVRGREKVKAGPNRWDEVKDDPKHYGDTFDYEIYDHAADQIIYPVCNAALQWCYKHLPEDCPRWMGAGYKVNHTELKYITEAMARDGLISEDEYVANMSENDNLMRSGE